jgi:ParB family chromosome partitioning protein
MNKNNKKTNKRLGRGIGSLLQVDLNDEVESRPEKINLKSPQKDVPEDKMVLDVDVADVQPNTEQPRKHFDDKALNELADSIKVQGIMQPIVTVKKGKTYEIIAGERRWRAAQKAGLKRVPIIVKEIDEQTKLEWAIIENVQRADLNPIEEGEAYKLLAEKYNLKQKEIAERVGKDRATVANVMRVTQADKFVKDLVVEGKMSLGHAKVLVSVEEPKLQRSLAEKVVRLNLSVRATESMIKKALSPDTKKDSDEAGEIEGQFKALETELLKRLGTKVKINEKGGRGKLEINFQNLNQFNQIVDRILN